VISKSSQTAFFLPNWTRLILNRIRVSFSKTEQKLYQCKKCILHIFYTSRIWLGEGWFRGRLYASVLSLCTISSYLVSHQDIVFGAIGIFYLFVTLLLVSILQLWSWSFSGSGIILLNCGQDWSEKRQNGCNSRVLFAGHRSQRTASSRRMTRLNHQLWVHRQNHYIQMKRGRQRLELPRLRRDVSVNYRYSSLLSSHCVRTSPSTVCNSSQRAACSICWYRFYVIRMQLRRFYIVCIWLESSCDTEARAYGAHNTARPCPSSQHTLESLWGWPYGPQPAVSAYGADQALLFIDKIRCGTGSRVKLMSPSDW